MTNDKNSKRKQLNVPEHQLPITPVQFKSLIDDLPASEQARMSIITKEFGEGFKFIRKYPLSISFFGSARFTEGNIHYEQARSLAKRIVSDLNYAVITGGGPGIMEAANRGATEAGGKSVGLLIRLANEQATNPYVQDSMEFHYFFSRKVLLDFAAEAYIFFPGGYGTMDEFFELVTLVQTKKIPWVPIILFGRDYWEPVEHFIKTYIYEKHGAIEKSDMNMYRITDNEDEVIEILKNSKVSPLNH